MMNGRKLKRVLIATRDIINEALIENIIFDIVNFTANIMLDKHISLVCEYEHIRTNDYSRSETLQFNNNMCIYQSINVI